MENAATKKSRPAGRDQTIRSSELGRATLIEFIVLLFVLGLATLLLFALASVLTALPGLIALLLLLTRLAALLVGLLSMLTGLLTIFFEVLCHKFLRARRGAMVI